MTITFGHDQVELGSPQLGLDLRDSQDLLGQGPALQQRLAEDGYLLIRQLHDPAVVLKARQTVLEHMREQTDAIELTQPLMAAQCHGDTPPPNMMGRQGIAHHPDVQAVLNSPRVFSLFDTLFGEPSITFDYKWLRAVGADAATPAHYDFVYMGRGSSRLHTIWTPFGTLTPELGSLAILVGSHNLPSYEKMRETYGKSDVDHEKYHGHFSSDLLAISDRLGGRWHTTTFEPGDVILFGMHTLHASTTNTTAPPHWRLSCDTRFQPAADPIDERWGGEHPQGHTGMTPQPSKKQQTDWHLDRLTS